MRVALGAVISASLLGCLQLTSSTDGGAVPSGSVSGETEDAAASAAGGTNCTDQAGGVVLCEQIAACPGVQVDPGALPNCGFRLGSATPIDLECECSGVLCPIGAPQSCENAAELLQGQSSLVVCEQASENLCLGIGESESEGGNVGAAPGCNTVCETECAGAPACIQLCGC